MNVTVENLTSCKKLVRFEIDSKAVDEAFHNAIKDLQKQVSLPGFRSGKVPEEVFLKKYEKEVADRAKTKLMTEAYQQALKDQKLSVVGYPEVEEVQFSRGQALQFVAKIETVPEFKMPDYRGLPAKREKRTVTDEDMQRALDALRTQRATFQDVARPLGEGDFVVVNYLGTCEGKRISDLAPVARGLTEQKNFWIEARKNSFLPGFSDQMMGASAGEKRTVKVDFPADFVTSEVAGKQGVYEVEVVAVKERLLPALDDAFAKSFEAEDLATLREGVRSDLQGELNFKQKKDIRHQVVSALMSQAGTFEVPEVLLQQETRTLVYEIVEDHKNRGLSADVIEQQKERIYALASQGAQARVRALFVFREVAEKEGIRISEQEINTQVMALAQNTKTPFPKLVKQLEERNGLQEIYQQLLTEKVINFLQEHARIEDIEPAGGAGGAGEGENVRA